MNALNMIGAAMLAMAFGATAAAADLEDKVKHGDADSHGVKIHYATIGSGPLVAFGAMLDYYMRNYPHEPYAEDTSPVKNIQMPVLMIHGLKDTALLAGALNNTWEWVEKDLTIVTVPTAGHFVQADEPAFVTKTIRGWLLR